MSQETGENDAEKNEETIHQVDVTTESVINRMLRANDKGASKRKDDLLDLEILLTQRQDRLFQALGGTLSI